MACSLGQLARAVARRGRRASDENQSAAQTSGAAHGAAAGAYIAAVVDNWDTATLVNRLELQLGTDLQYLRINGTLVGGLVGLVIFTLSRAYGG